MTNYSITDLSHILEGPIRVDPAQRRSTAQRFIDGAPSDLDMLLDMAGLGEFS